MRDFCFGYQRWKFSSSEACSGALQRIFLLDMYFFNSTAIFSAPDGKLGTGDAMIRRHGMVPGRG